jgi:GntR family transcriptional regulator
MFFSIDPGGEVAIYEQIVRQVKYAIAEQTLRPGQLLPSVRALSQQLAINPNTVARAYQLLQADGMLESLRGRGLAVCSDVTAKCQRLRQELLAERIAAVLRESLHGGLTPDQIREIVETQLQHLNGKIVPIGHVTPPDSSLSPSSVPSLPLPDAVPGATKP